VGELHELADAFADQPDVLGAFAAELAALAPLKRDRCSICREPQG